MTPKELEQLYKQVSKFDKHMGMTFEVSSPGEVIYKMIVKEHHLSSPNTCHGGALAAMMDAILGVPVLTYSVTMGMLCATVEFKMNFLGPAHLGDELIGTNTIDFKGNRLVVSSGQIKNAKTGNLLAKGMGTFNLYPGEKKDFFNLEDQS